MSRVFSGKKKIKVTMGGKPLICTFFAKGLGGRPSATCYSASKDGGSTKTAKKAKKSKRRGR